MSEIPLRPTGEVGHDGCRIKRRTMTAEEILEREELNRENTAPRLRAKVLAGLNGKHQ